MRDVAVPHFSLPFQFVSDANGVHAAVNEQDTTEDIFDCVNAVVRYEPGQRLELPQFGITDQAFRQGLVDTELIREQVNRWEGRARVDLVDRLASDDELKQAVETRVQSRLGFGG